MGRPIGRPMKYNILIEALDDDQLYTPATIVNFALANKLIKATAPQDIRLERQRIRISLGRFSNNHQFPDEGDGMVKIKGQAPIPGWFGWRWKAAVWD